MKRVVFLLAMIWISLGTSPAYAQKVERVTFVGGPPAGVFGIFATGIGTYVSKNVPNLDVSVAATAGSEFFTSVAGLGYMIVRGKDYHK